MKISQLPHNSRPRERLLRLGPQILSTKELLMIVFGTGTKSIPINLIANNVEKLLQEKSSLEISLDQLRKIPGIGTAKACLFLAAKEIFERFSSLQQLQLTTPNLALSHLQQLQNSQKECVIGLYLSARFTLVHKETLAIGSLNQSILDPKDIFAPIRHHPVAYIILSHNHPSGDPTPSEEDIALTLRIAEAGHLIGVELLDHIVVAKEKFISMKETGLLNTERIFKEP